ncbi:helix-turn-helix transcriptional regulator [Diaminobutyricibacter tongyongensis]|uniref:Helix-turn-helix transcriptional regulator n=1 Tax=Leifsonia tongyongensis TaxID=1268043 RepID=A0A6L9Y1P7_9MICO|nr:helix-turn-helix transcriptional regulator [Diaminobutyricibacter tongyongensis]
MTKTDPAKIAKARAAASNGEGRALRLKNRLSLSEVASVCEVDQSAVWRWEQGERAPRAAAAIRYANLLDILRGLT